MATKLTLSIKGNIILRAKRYAKTNNTSLSQLVEQYFSYLTTDQVAEDVHIDKAVKELSGIIELDDDFDLKSSYGNYLKEKYIK